MNKQKNNIVEQGTITLNKRNICIEHGATMSNKKKQQHRTRRNNNVEQEEQHYRTTSSSKRNNIVERGATKVRTRNGEQGTSNED